MVSYEIDYNDKRFEQVEADKQEALSEVEQVYSGMINQSDAYYQNQISAVKDWEEKQSQLQQEQTDFTIEQIEQQREQAQKDYIKEQSGAYVDWQKQSNQYGANAEQIAAQGLSNSGYSESSQVSMYNTYQNRVATARESYNQAVLNYNNAIKDARLQNNAALAEIAYNALQQQLELSLEGFQYKNSPIIAQSDKKLAVDETYYNRYQDVLQQINTENALAESIRQFEANYDLQVKQYEESIRQFNEEIARLKEQDAAQNALAIQQLELQKAQLEEEKRQFDATMASKSSSSGSSSRSSGGGSGSSDSDSINKSPSGFTGSTRQEAVAYMEANGVPASTASNVMTQSEWSRRKASYSTTGQGGVEVKNYDTYKEYLSAYTKYTVG